MYCIVVLCCVMFVCFWLVIMFHVSASVLCVVLPYVFFAHAHV